MRTRQLELHATSARAVVAALRGSEPTSDEIYDAFWQLDALSIDDVRDALASWVGPLPDPERLDAATRLAHGLPPPRLRLRTLASARDADVLDLGSVAEEQLRIAGATWDGADLAPEERLDGELEGSFAGTLERRVLADADANGETPLYDVLLFAGDSGVVFAAGTTSVVALIAYGKVETRDRRTRAAIEEALAPPGEVAPVASSPSVIDLGGESREEHESAAPKAEKPIATTAKKTLTRKAPARKAPVSAKTAAPKKVAAKKAASKKGPAKKAASKKVAAKKTAAKKAPAKKTVRSKRAKR